MHSFEVDHFNIRLVLNMLCLKWLWDVTYGLEVCSFPSTTALGKPDRLLDAPERNDGTAVVADLAAELSYQESTHRRFVIPPKPARASTDRLSAK